MFVCYIDTYIEFLKGLMSGGDCDSERVNEREAEGEGNRMGDRDTLGDSERRYSALVIAKDSVHRQLSVW